MRHGSAWQQEESSKSSESLLNPEPVHTVPNGTKHRRKFTIMIFLDIDIDDINNPQKRNSAGWDSRNKIIGLKAGDPGFQNNAGTGMALNQSGSK